MNWKIENLNLKNVTPRRTTSDDIYDAIYQQITKLEIVPGTKLSEVEIARHFEVSRQPVREAFIRLSNAGLLLIRPQKATVVRKISLKEVANARFMRMAIELEIGRHACANFNSDIREEFEENIEAQSRVIESGKINKFGALDIIFHKLMCVAAKKADAYDTISVMKSKVDRLCMLSLADEQECREVLEDHKQIIRHMDAGDEVALLDQIRSHLSRLDSTIEVVSKSHAHYFEQ